ncbi:MAG: lactonase family protein, partial [Microbacterium gubbeenense]
MTDFLVLVANAGDGSISTFRLNDEGLERIAVTEGVTGCSTFAVDGDRNLVYAAVKPDATSEFPGVLTLALDRETGAL